IMSPLHALRAVPSTSLVPPFFFTAPSRTELSTLSLHDALPISRSCPLSVCTSPRVTARRLSITAWCTCPANWPMTCPATSASRRSEEHTSELQSRENLVCRLLLEKKKKIDEPPHLHATTPKMTT